MFVAGFLFQRFLQVTNSDRRAFSRYVFVSRPRGVLTGSVTDGIVGLIIPPVLCSIGADGEEGLV